jgi:CelD/BcsL family acetyltransferase involved in cellulose biosynthesis
LLAWSWTQALGCDDPAIGQAGRRAEAVVRAEFVELTASGAAAEIVTDLTLEQAAFLAEVGADDVLTDQWVDAVVAAQGTDGGWDLNGAGSHWHPTLLAVWVLSASTGPGAQATWVRQ